MKRGIPTSLRVALLAALLALASNLAMIGFIHWRTHDDAMSAHRQRVVEEAAALADVYRSGGRQALDAAVRDSLSQGDPQLLAAILDGRGAPRAGNVVTLQLPERGPRPGYQDGAVRIRPQARPIEAGYVLRRLDGGAWLLSGRSYGERLSLQRTLERSLLLAVAISVLLGLLCGLVMARYVGRRVSGIASVARDISRGDMARRVPITGGGDAFDRLAEQINAMLDRIGTLMEELRLLTDCLAHDLRSPVGRLRARVDAVLAAHDEEKREALLAGVVNEADALMRILTTVLEIGRSEAMTSRNQFTWLDPHELVAELAEMYEPIAEEAGASLRLDIRGVLLPTFGHRQLLAQALSNLVDNAVKYAESGREFVVFAEQTDQEIHIGVADRGPGIEPSEHAEARRRFGRLDSSRSAGGAGLGLALAEAVAHLHRGRLELQDNSPGLRVFIAIPAGPAG